MLILGSKSRPNKIEWMAKPGQCRATQRSPSQVHFLFKQTKWATHGYNIKKSNFCSLPIHNSWTRGGKKLPAIRVNLQNKGFFKAIKRSFRKWGSPYPIGQPNFWGDFPDKLHHWVWPKPRLHSYFWVLFLRERIGNYPCPKLKNHITFFDKMYPSGQNYLWMY